MGKQTGPLQVTGGIGNLSFYHHRRYGYLVRRKGGASPEKVKQAPEFARTRENASEFGHAAKAGKLIRTAVRAGLQLTGDATVTQRLTQRLTAIIKLDSVHERGQRTVASGLEHADGRAQLQGMSFFERTPLDSVLKKRVHYAPDTGLFLIQGFQPLPDLVHPTAATHVRLQGMSGFFDFASGHYRYSATPVTELSLADTAFQDVLLQVPEVIPATEEVAIGFLKVTFFQEKNGDLYALQEGLSLGMF